MQVAPQVSPLLLRHHGQQGPHKLLGGATAPAQGDKYGFILHVHVHDQSVIETRHTYTYVSVSPLSNQVDVRTCTCTCKCVHDKTHQTR